MVFGTIADDTNKSGQSLTLFHKKLTDIINDYKSVDDKIGNKKIGAAVNGLFGKTPTISNSDIEALREYNALLASGETEYNASQKALSGVSKQAKQLALDANGAAVSERAMAQATTTLSTTSKTATLATNALRIGLNMLANVGVMLFINAVVSGITKLINKQKEAEEAAAQLKQEQEERRQAAIESSKATEQEIKSIHDLTERYVKLYSSTNDITTIKGELSSIQDEIIDKYGKEAEGIDAVNGKLSENLEYMRELEEKENNQWLVDNAEGIQEAKKYLKNLDDVMLKFDAEAKDFSITNSDGTVQWKNNGKNDYERAVQESKSYYNYIKRNIEKEGMADYFNFIDEISGDWARNTLKHRYAFEFADGLSDEQKVEAYEKLLEIYTDMLNTSIAKVEDYFDISGKKLERLNDRVKEIIDKHGILKDEESRIAQNDKIKSMNDKNPVYQQYKEYIDQMAAISQEINNPEITPGEIFSKQLDLEDLREKILALKADLPTLSDEAERTFNNMGLNIDGTIASTDNLRESFFETLDEMQKGTLTNVDTIEKAMKTLAEGGELEHMEVWNIMQLDEDKITHPFYDEDIGKLKMDYKELARLKNHLIKKERERLQIAIETAKQARQKAQNELATVDAQIEQESKGNLKARKELTARQAEIRNQIEEWGDEIQRNELLIRDLNSSLGNTIQAEKKIKELQEDINKLQEQADNYEKAFTQKVDNVIDSLESEKEILNDELDSLNDQLDVLEKQKDELDEIIDNYKQVADIVSDAVDKEKELLEEQKKSQEDAYNERINALKEAHEQQEEENELTEKQIALQEKLQALDKAKQNKVMTYSSERGWHYDVDKEELLSAQKEVDNAQKDIDDTLAERAYEAEIKALEDERDSVLESYDLQIEAYENYVKEWKEILEEQTNAENERLAQEILGVEWREKIKDKDAQILNNYKSEFCNYNSQLTTLVNGEMENLNQSIEAKNEEIKAKQELIDQWKTYKSEVQNAINDIKNANEDYMQYLGSIALDENSSFEAREANLAAFAEKYKSYMDEIIEKNNELEEANNRITESMAALSEIQLSVDSAIDIASEAISNALGAIAGMTIFGNHTDFGRFFYDTLGILPGYSNGGTADYTGLAMLHGTKSKPELILNNTDAAKLYNMIHDPSFTDMMMEKQYGHLIRSIPTNNNSTNNTSNTINIDRMEVVANDPIQFHEQFQKELKQHYRFALSESKVW